MAVHPPTDFDFHPLTEAHLPMLHAWLLRPHVAAWWGPAESVDELREDYIAHAHEPRATRAFIAMHRGRPMAFVQVYAVMGSGDGWWPDETDPGARGTDQFLADEADLGRGLGSAMLQALLARLFEDVAVMVVQTDPQPHNARAIRCYEKSGFEPVGVVETPDGKALLMRCTRQSMARRAGCA